MTDSRTERASAVGLVQFGGPEVLQLVECDVPELGPDDIRIRVRAAAINPSDIVLRSGERAGAFADIDPPYVVGMDAAGTVEAVGAAVSGIAQGDRVMTAVNHYLPAGGAQRTVLVVPGASAVVIPDELGTEAAATLPMNGLTAVEALDRLNLREGMALAITGGTGWLATLAIVLAKARGLRVLVDAPPEEFERVQALGADEAVRRGDGVAERIRALAPDGVDAVFDTASVGPAILAAIRDGGGWAVVRGQQDETERGIVRHTVSVAGRLADTAALAELGRRAAQGDLPATVAATYRPEQAAEAHRRQEAGGVRGRLVIVF